MFFRISDPTMKTGYWFTHEAQYGEKFQETFDLSVQLVKSWKLKPLHPNASTDESFKYNTSIET